MTLPPIDELEKSKEYRFRREFDVVIAKKLGDMGMANDPSSINVRYAMMICEALIAAQKAAL